MHLLEEGGIGLLLAEQPVDHAFQQAVQLVTAQIIVITPAQGRPRQFVEQTPGWVRGPVEQALVGYGDAQDRQLHAADQRFQGRWQLGIVQHEIEQHRYQTDDIIIHPVKLAHFPGLPELLAQLSVDVPAQLMERGVGLRLLMVGKTVQHAEQFFTGHRWCRGRAQRAQGDIAAGMTPVADQFAEQ